MKINKKVEDWLRMTYMFIKFCYFYHSHEYRPDNILATRNFYKFFRWIVPWRAYSGIGWTSLLCGTIYTN